MLCFLSFSKYSHVVVPLNCHLQPLFRRRVSLCLLCVSLCLAVPYHKMSQSTLSGFASFAERCGENNQAVLTSALPSSPSIT